MISQRVVLELKSGDHDLPEEFPLTWIGQNRFMLSTMDMVSYLKKAIKHWMKKNKDLNERRYEEMIEIRCKQIRDWDVDVHKTNYFDHKQLVGCGSCNPNFFPNKCGNCTMPIHPQLVMNQPVPVPMTHNHMGPMGHSMAPPLHSHVIEKPIVIEKSIVYEKPAYIESERDFARRSNHINNFNHHGYGHSHHHGHRHGIEEYGYSSMPKPLLEGYPYYGNNQMVMSHNQPWATRSYNDYGNIRRNEKDLARGLYY